MKIGKAVALAAIMAAATTHRFCASSGADIYKAKCQSCHGSAGIPIGNCQGHGREAATTGAEKMSQADMIAATSNGLGKMQPFKGKLTEIRSRLRWITFRTFVK